MGLLPERWDPRRALRERRSLADDLELFESLETITAQQAEFPDRLVATVIGFRRGKVATAAHLVLDDPAPPDDPSRGRRCSVCAIAWPPVDAYRTCPLCGEDTGSVMRGLDDVLSEDEARERAKGD